jgi:[ribosomal protein S5]-alanine N-acetyltransferase
MEFTLRPWAENDLESLVKHANNPRIAQNLMNRFPHPYTEATAKAFIGMAMATQPVTIMAIEVEGAAAGGIGLHQQEDVYAKNAELGYWLAEPYWGNGIITHAVGQMVAYGFQHLDITRIFARPFGTNLASQRVLEKAGFGLEGRFEKTIFKNGVYQDELVYAVRKSSTS